MDSLFKRFQDVVEMGKEQDGANALSHDPAAATTLTSSSDPVVLRRHIGTLTQQLARQVQAYEELRIESTGMEKELTRLRLRFATSRELWDIAQEQLETVIQNLLEHQLYDNAQFAAGSGAGPAAAAAASSAAALDATYVASLQEQIHRLKEMVQRSGEERSQLRSEKQYEQTQLLLRSSGLAGAELDAEVRQALEKMTDHWQEERLQYESTIESLEQHVARHAEREALLGDQVKHEKEQRQNTITSTVQQELRAAVAELEEWRSGARALSHTRSPHSCSLSRDAAAASHTTPDPDGKTADDHLGVPPLGRSAHLLSVASTERINTGASTPMARRTPTELSTDARALLDQQAELELLRHENGAREEALDSLYADNKHLQEALQRVEAQARQCDADLLTCQAELEEVRRLFSREQQRARKSEEDSQKAAAVEARLREQVRELRQALSAVVPPLRSGGGLSIPSGRGVRVGQPSRFEVVEQELTYEDGGTWKEWAVEAWRWWKELKGDAMPLRAPLSGGGGVGTSRRAGGGAVRRGPRVLLLFAAMVGVIMTLFLVLSILESMYAALRTPEEVYTLPRSSTSTPY